MTTTTTSAPTGVLPVSDELSSLRGLFGAYAQLTKARLSLLVLWTAAVGYLVSGVAIEPVRFLCALIGTLLAAFSASALNQVVEARLDAMMPRTRSRPIPSGRISRGHAWLLGCVLGFTGVATLALGTTLLAAGLALATIILYVGVYTPLKTRTTFNTMVGAVVGGLPPLIGWTAATGEIGAGGLALGGLLFVWQIPHFLALAWMYRDDYALGGFRMLPVVDPEGGMTARMIVLSSMLLVPVGLLIMLLGVGGWVYGLGSVLLAAWMIHTGVQLLRGRTDAEARKVFGASIGYLTLLLIVLVVDQGPMG